MNFINQFLDGTGNWGRSMLCVAIFIAELTKLHNFPAPDFNKVFIAS